jgi:serine O-acetyltransferase
VIRNLMERIDSLENELGRLQACLREVAAGRPLLEPCRGQAQNLRDREIIEFLGEDSPGLPELEPGAPAGEAPGPQAP